MKILWANRRWAGLIKVNYRQLVVRWDFSVPLPDPWNKGCMDLSWSMCMELGFGNQHRPQTKTFAQRMQTNITSPGSSFPPHSYCPSICPKVWLWGEGGQEVVREWLDDPCTVTRLGEVRVHKYPLCRVSWKDVIINVVLPTYPYSYAQPTLNAKSTGKRTVANKGRFPIKERRKILDKTDKFSLFPACG